MCSWRGKYFKEGSEVLKLLCFLAFVASFANGIFTSIEAMAYDDDKMVDIMRLLGAQTVEDVTEDEYEEYSSMLDNPIRLNLVSSSRLLSSGLVTPYQAASIEDYISRHGDILSKSELALLDGFSEVEASRIAPFVSFESSALIGRASMYDKKVLSNDIHIKSGWKLKDSRDFISYGVKYTLKAAGSEFGMAVSEPYSNKRLYPDAHSLYYSYHGRGGIKLTVGDYYLRYGQGLAMWTGFSMSGIGSPASLCKRPHGVTPCRSWTGSRAVRGVAGEFVIGRWTLSASLGIKGAYEIMTGKSHGSKPPLKWNEGISLVPVTNVAYMHRNFRLSATVAAIGLDAKKGSLRAAFDYSACIRGVDFWGEVATDIFSAKVAAVTGVVWNCCDNLKTGICLRYYPNDYDAAYTGAVRASSKCSNEHGMAVSGDFSAGKWVKLAGQDGFMDRARRFTGNFSLDFGYFPFIPAVSFPAVSMSGKYIGCGTRQMKVLLNCNCRIDSLFAVSVRLSERLRYGGSRANLSMTGQRALPLGTIREQRIESLLNCRMDVRYKDANWRGTARLNVVYGKTLAWLTYLEGGYANGKVTAFFRGGCFKIDDWADRIYAYEHDAPGSFNVPVFYGRGYWLSAFVCYKHRKLLKFYLKGTYTSWPWQIKGKEKNDRAELSVHLILSL